MKTKHLLIAFFLGVVIFGVSSEAQTSAFTYQGRLTDSAMPATETFDFQFALYDALTGGTQVGTTQTHIGLTVANGIFTVQLDFGVAAFSGADRFIEIRVKRPAEPAYTTLAPRQKLNSVPYSVRSANASAADNAASLGGVAANLFVQTNDARLADARPPTPGSQHYIQNRADQQPSSDFNISGIGTAAILNATTQFNLGGNRVLSIAGFENIFAGAGAGQVNTGGHNSFFGSKSGFSNTSGQANSFFGAWAGYSNTTGFLNSIFGTFAGASNSGGSYNTFLGAYAGVTNTTGGGNVFVGSDAGRRNTTGSGNVFIGANAGYFNTTGDANFFFGNAAGYNNTTACCNIFIGGNAGQNNFSGAHNVFIGHLSGLQNNAGAHNVFVGSTTAPNNSGSNNTLLGYSSGYSNLVGNDNALFGFNAGYNSNATDNTFIGSRAGYGNSTGARNVFVGKNAGEGNTTGSDNTALGAGSNIPVGNNNTVIGAGTSVSGTQGTLTYATAIGSGAVAESSNTIVLGRSSGVDIVRIWGQLYVNSTINVGTLESSVGSVALCRNGGRLSFCSSSLRYKTEIEPYTRGLEVINLLRPITFKAKVNGVQDLGFGAEEVAVIEPLFTFDNDEGQIEGVRYDRIGVVLVNAIKEQQAQIEAQQKQIEELKAKAAQVDALIQLVCSQNKEAALCKED